MKPLLIAIVLAVTLAVPTIAQAYCSTPARSASTAHQLATFLLGARADLQAGRFAAAHDKAYHAFIDYDVQMACDARSLKQRPHLLNAIVAFNQAYKQYQAGHADLGLPYLTTMKSELAIAGVTS